MEKLTEKELELIECLKPRKGDGYGHSFRRFAQKMDSDAGAGLYDCVYFKTLIDIVLKLESRNVGFGGKID
jgi:hypothetical protein